MCDAMLTDALSFKFVFLRLWKRKVIQLNDKNSILFQFPDKMYVISIARQDVTTINRFLSLIK